MRRQCLCRRVQLCLCLQYWQERLQGHRWGYAQALYTASTCDVIPCWEALNAFVNRDANSLAFAPCIRDEAKCCRPALPH